MAWKERALRLSLFLHLMIPLLCAWCFYVTVSHEAARRILALDTVENYAFAVYNQLLWNFSHAGQFQQTIHRGYDNSWMWSGHKAALLPVIGYLYGLRPSPVWLAQLGIGAVALGAFPAYALGRLCVGGLLGGMAGLALYFGYPPLYYMALQDYQDTVLSIPLLLAAIYLSRSGRPVGFAVAALLACAVREEIALMVGLIGFGVPGGWRRKLGFGLLGAGISATYLGGLYGFFHGQMRFEAPAQTQLKALLAHFPPILPPLLYDKAEALRFYLGLIRPFQWLSLAAPLTLLPGAAALSIHIMVNPGNGVERVWAHHAHIHHLAPLVPLFIGASLESLGKGVAFLRSRGWYGGVAARAAVVGLLVGAPLLLPAGVGNLELEPGLSLQARPHPVHPVWRLVRQVPPSAVVATDTRASLAVAARPESYTYDESLEEKIRLAEPLDRVDYLLVNRKDAGWEARGRARPGARVLGEADQYVLIQLR